ATAAGSRRRWTPQGSPTSRSTSRRTLRPRRSSSRSTAATGPCRRCASRTARPRRTPRSPRCASGSPPREPPPYGLRRRSGQRAAEPLFDERPRDRGTPRQDHLARARSRLEPGPVEPARLLDLDPVDDDVGALRPRLEGEHERGGERPRLRAAVLEVRHGERDLLEHLAAQRLLGALPRLDEARERREASLGP